MSKLTDQVPPLELCKEIPAGSFEDSVLVWTTAHDGEPMIWFRWPLPFEDIIAPAPTLQEITDKIIAESHDCVVVLDGDKSEWGVEVVLYGRRRVNFTASEKNPTIAAMKLWLNMRGKDVKL